MRLRFLKTRTLPIGIDLGTAVMKMAQLRQTEGELELLAVACAEVPGGCRDDAGKRFDFLAGCIPSLLKSHPFQGRRCIMALPACSTFVQHVKTGKIAPAEMDKALRWEMEGKLPFDPAGAVIRHMIAGETFNEREPGLEVIVVAASNQVVEAHLDLARRCKLEVVALDVEPCAILECFARLFRRVQDSKRGNLFLDLGYANTQVVIAHGTKLVFTRNLMLGARQIDEAAAGALKMSAEDIRALRQKLAASPEPRAEANYLYDAIGEALETMTGEITKCLRYYESVFPSTPVERVIFLGGQASDRRLCERIAQRVNLPAQIGDPLARVVRGKGVGAEGDIDRREAQPTWAVAIGLSLGATMPEAA